MPRRLAPAALALAIVAVALELGASLGRPLLWNDEGETAMYAERVLAFGYPAIDDGRNVVFECSCPREIGARGNVYVGSTWGQYLLGAVGSAWAHASNDVGARTARLRLPFAATGFLAILLVAASTAAFFRDRTPALLAATAVVALCGLSLPLVLHLRQARHPGPATLLAVAAVAVHLRRWVLGRGGLGAELLEALLLVLLWHVFHPSALLLAGALASERALAAVRRERGRARILAALRDARAVWIAALVLVPSVLYWRPFRLAASIRPRRPLTLGLYAAHWRQIGVEVFALRDHLAPALLALAVAAVSFRRGGLAPARRTQLAAAQTLLVICGFYLVALSWLPFVFTRYAVELSPLLAQSTVLAGCVVLRGPRGARGVLAAGMCAWLAWAGPLRISELSGFVRSLVAPPEGPIDATVAVLRAAYRDPSQLTIGTNYEVPSLQWYLGARVSRGPFDAAPDAIIRRSGWPDDGGLGYWCDRGDYRRVQTGVADWPWNDIPELGRSIVPTPHRWTTPRPGVDGPPLVVFLR